jgi:hypothetical protein
VIKRWEMDFEFLKRNGSGGSLSSDEEAVIYFAVSGYEFLVLVRPAPSTRKFWLGVVKDI